MQWYTLKKPQAQKLVDKHKVG